MEPETLDAAQRGAAGEYDGWNPALPEHLPTRTPWPVATAFGTVLLFWGIVTSYLIVGIGLGLLALSAVGWVNEIRREGTHRE